VVRKLKACRPIRRACERTDPGQSGDLPVFDLHRIYSGRGPTRLGERGPAAVQASVCLECKAAADRKGWWPKSRACASAPGTYQDNPDLVKNLLPRGAEKGARNGAHYLDDGAPAIAPARE